ncbi:MAG: hypothetical protein QOI11_1810 [Candidatus Eremiobacteraeota bacterium]|jgi:hypothetical protein|nr:hypothetical protein [Candidatus Eremiobacteraeota bacterium]
MKFARRPDPRPVEYLFIDHNRLRSLAEQFGVHRATDAASSIEATLGILNLGISSKPVRGFRDSSPHEMIEGVIRALRSMGKLESERPRHDSMTGMASYYVLEEMVAKRVILPLSKSSSMPGLPDRFVWVSDPPRAPVADNAGINWEPQDTFVYLAESRCDDMGTQQVPLSAFSALNLIVRNIAQPLALDQSWYRHDPILDNRSPSELLAAIGGLSQPPRRIKSLYYTRFISNEQFVKVNDNVCRYYDLLGYPVFIAAA